MRVPSKEKRLKIHVDYTCIYIYIINVYTDDKCGVGVDRPISQVNVCPASSSSSSSSIRYKYIYSVDDDVIDETNYICDRTSVSIVFVCVLWAER